MTWLAEESVLLRELGSLLEQGSYQALLQRLETVPRDSLLHRTPFALVAGEAHGRLGDGAEAGRWALVALEVARAKGERHAELRARNLQGAVALMRGDADEAEQHFSAALEMAGAAGDHGLQARCLNNLGIIANLRGDAKGALACYQLALAAWQQAGQGRGMAETYHNIEISRRDLGDLRGALQATDEAMRLAIQLHDDALVARALTGRAELHLLLGDATLAAAELRRAEAAYSAAKYPARVPEVWRLQAAVARQIGDLPDAVQLLEKARTSCRQIGSAHTLAEIERDLGAALDAQGDAAGARAARERALAVYTRLGAKKEAAKLAALLASV
jgi:tetratricopeptide (TPR) repeat protein